MNRRYVWGVFLYSLLYVLIVIGVTVLVPNIGGEYVLRLSRQLSSFSIFTILFVIQEVILLVLLRGVFLRIQRSRKKGRRSLWTYFQDKWVRRGWKAFRKYVVGVFFVYLGITAWLNALLLHFNISLPGLFGEQMVLNALAQVGVETQRQTVLFVGMIALVWPFIEELVYRWFFTHVLMRHRWMRGVIVSAFLFALAHAEPGVMINLIILSLFLGYSYFKTESLRYPRLFHVLINGMAVMVMLTTKVV